MTFLDITEFIKFITEKTEEHFNKDGVIAPIVHFLVDSNKPDGKKSHMVLDATDFMTSVNGKEMLSAAIKKYLKPIQFYVQYYKTPYMLVNDGDIHELGDAFDSAIINLAISLLRGEQSQDESKTYYALYLEDIKDLKKYYLDKIDWLPKLRPAMFSRGGRRSSFSYRQIGNGLFGPRYY